MVQVYTTLNALSASELGLAADCCRQDQTIVLYSFMLKTMGFGKNSLPIGCHGVWHNIIYGMVTCWPDGPYIVQHCVSLPHKLFEIKLQMSTFLPMDGSGVLKKGNSWLAVCLSS